MFPRLYHAHHSRQMEDLPFWSDLARKTGGRILELGCGTGRLTVPLSVQGHDLTGIDNDHFMLDYLRESIAPGAGSPSLIRGDFRFLPLAAVYQLIILPCNTYSTLDGDARLATLGSVRRVLAEGGIFAVSMPNPDILRSLPRHSELEEEDEFLLDDGSAVIVSSGWDRKKDELTFHWVYDWLQPSGGWERFEADAKHILVSIERYLDEFRQFFVDVEIYGGYDLSENLNESEHVVIIAR